MRFKLSYWILTCYLWLNYSSHFCSPQPQKCYAGSTSRTQTCEFSVSPFDENNDVTILNVIKCSHAPLSRDTFQNLRRLRVLSISCNFSDDRRLKLEAGIFSPMNGSLVQLNLNVNNMETVPGGTFCGLTNLTQADLSRNSLRDITDAGFGRTGCEKHLPEMSLRDLNIAHNSIRVLQNGTFDRLSHLWNLNASNNGLKEIEGGAFEGLVALRVLDLSGNELVTIPQDVFENLPTLHNLNLANNKLVFSSLSAARYPASLQIVSLGNNDLSGVLRFQNLNHFSELDLSNNHFEVLQSGFGPLESLTTLLISNAGIRQIEPAAFQGLSMLKYLKLNGNRLSGIEPGTFDPCPYLRFLDFGDNALHVLPDTSRLTNLITLNLSRNNISKIDDMANWTLNKLQNLDLSENVIESIERRTFQNLRSLVQLNLTQNAITRIEPGTFDSMAPQPSTSSVYLYLDYNRLTTIDGAFSSTNVTFLSVSHNELQNFSYSSIPSGLQTLDLNHNKIRKLINEIGPSVFEQIRVRTIDFSHNKLKRISNNDVPPWTEELFFHNNSIEWIDEVFLKPLFRLRTLTLHDNRLEVLCPQVLVDRYESRLLTTTLSGNPFACSCELNWMRDTSRDQKTNYGYIQDLSKVKCNNVFPKYGNFESFIVRLWQSQMLLCHSTHESPNSCNCTMSRTPPCDIRCPEKCTCYRDKDFQFAIVDCSLANLTSAPGKHFQKFSRMHLYLDGNTLDEINETMFEPYSNVVKLFLNSSKVRDIQDSTFLCLKSLTVLHLENNLLQTLPVTVFEELHLLEELYLDHNEITHLSIAIFVPLKSLLVLDLSNNLLQNFTVWHVTKLPKLSHLGLQRNPWSCECYFVERFRHWLQDNVQTVNDAEKVECITGTGKATPLLSSSFAHCHLDGNVQQTTSTASVWGSVLGIVVLLMVACVLIFVYRREMQVLLYSRYGVRIFTHQIQENEAGKLYDAFISYSCLDEEFLVHDFLPGLEQIEDPYRLCLHHRHFTVGAFITENIMDAVEKSRRTILLLSENFIQSEWCRFEFKTAHVQMLKDRCNRVIIIVLGQIPKNLDPEMKLYLTTNTYLTWGDKLFWDKLYFSLPDKKQNKNDPTI